MQFPLPLLLLSIVSKKAIFHFTINIIFCIYCLTFPLAKLTAHNMLCTISFRLISYLHRYESKGKGRKTIKARKLWYDLMFTVPQYLVLVQL